MRRALRIHFVDLRLTFPIAAAFLVQMRRNHSSEDLMTTDTQTQLYTTMESPIGELLLLGDGEALHGLYMQGGRRPVPIADDWQRAEEPFADARRQLDEYFAGDRVEFDLALAATGSEFERTVWRALRQIPYGETISYGELARRIGRPDRARAVGAANGRNPISIVVPCHRVIGADGSLTGYGGGLDRKRFLLDLEQGTLRLA
jgi:methylated-DNA-[protein]-cysteine S-methyltransferase